MDKIKHEIESALAWLEEGNIDRVKLHLSFALAHLSDEAAEQERAPDVCPECAGSGKTGSIGLPRECPYCDGAGKRR
jgi:DnaJ-class molecular chaperone